MNLIVLANTTDPILLDSCRCGIEDSYYQVSDNDAYRIPGPNNILFSLT